MKRRYEILLCKGKQVLGIMVYDVRVRLGLSHEEVVEQICERMNHPMIQHPEGWEEMDVRRADFRVTLPRDRVMR